jgi:uncharacterized 2Fe-2S/4Fe-4S cluster protein (DUF4445 family)
MGKDIIVEFLPYSCSYKTKAGTNLLEVIQKAGLKIKSECAGLKKCGQCKIRLVKGKLEPTYHQRLSKEALEAGWRLACMSKVSYNITIEIPKPDFYLETEPKDLAYSLNLPSLGPSLSPLSYWLELQLYPYPDYSDVEKIHQALLKSNLKEPFKVSLQVLKKLPKVIRHQKGKISLLISQTQNGVEILDIKPGSQKRVNLGLGIDIGTTNVTVGLVDLNTGKVIGIKTSLNRQILYGQDVITRIIAIQAPETLKYLHSLVIETINTMIESFKREKKIKAQDITCASICGNTTMIHLFMGVDPRYILKESCPGVSTEPLYFKASELGLKIHPQGVIYILPGSGAWIGGDVLSGLFVSKLYEFDGIGLYVDIGTNGEIVLGGASWLVACSCSAGPAFEGSGVSCGMQAQEGAIEHLRISTPKESPWIKVIGNKEPKGICGSGLIDLLAELRRNQLIDKKGKFVLSQKTPQLKKTDKGCEYTVAFNKKQNRELSIKEYDISILLSTKAAFYAGITVILKELSIEPQAIGKVILSGRAGEAIDIKQMISIGMLPAMPYERFSYIPQAGLLGACLALVYSNVRETLQKIKKKITYLDLSESPKFMEEFTAALFLPHTDESLFSDQVKEDYLKRKNL